MASNIRHVSDTETWSRHPGSSPELCIQCSKYPPAKPRRICTRCRASNEREARKTRIEEQSKLPCNHDGCPDPRVVTKTQVRPYCTKHMREYGRVAQERARREDGAPVRPPRPTQVPEGQHWCSGHAAFHPVDQFHKAAGKSKGLQSSCKDWQADQQRARYEANPEAVKEVWRERSNRNRRLHAYGLSQEDYVALLVAQDGRCRVCSTRGLLHVDHDHDHPEPRSKAAIRGLLCGNCNTAEGQLQSDPERMLRLAWYTKHHGDMTGVEEFLTAALPLLS